MKKIISLGLAAWISIASYTPFLNIQKKAEGAEQNLERIIARTRLQEPTRILRVGGIGEYTSIPNAVNSATGGEEIQVAAGIYQEDYFYIDLPGKNITLKGGYNQYFTARGENSIIDGSNGTGLGCLGIYSSATIDGFTFRNCFAEYGAAITGVLEQSQNEDITIENNTIEYNTNTNPAMTGAIDITSQDNSTLRLKIRSNIIKNNTGGSGIFVTAGYTGTGQNTYLDAIIENNTVTENNSGDNNGAGILVRSVGTSQSNILLNNNTITNNLGTQSGSGMYLIIRESSKTTATIKDNRIEWNKATYNGGGLSVFDETGLSTFNIDRNIFRNNQAGSGGGLSIESTNTTDPASTFQITRNRFEKNLALMEGGGLFIEGRTNSTTMNNIFKENTAGNEYTEGWGGGALIRDMKSITMTNDTIFRNRTVKSTGNANQTKGGGIYLAANATITNMISRENEAEIGGDLCALGNVTARYSNINKMQSILNGSITLSNTYNVDPLFNSIKNLTLRRESTMIDAGDVNINDKSMSQGQGTSRSDIGKSGGDMNDNPILLEEEKGDVNGDGMVTVADAILSLQASTGMNTENKIIQDYATSGVDVDGDKRVGLAEAMYAIQKAAGLR